MTKRRLIHLSLFVIALVILAGCVAPPKETSTAGSSNTNSNSGAPPVAATTLPPTATSGSVYVTLVTPTPAATTTMESQGYSEIVTQTIPPEDRSCRIFTHTQTFTYNGTAFTFDLKNPPMYITYKVTPSEIEVRKVRTHSTNKTEYLLEYDTFDPLSFMEITVKNKETGEVYLQDGFGTDYTQYTTRTLKVLNSADMYIEIKGNRIKGTIEVWVKPVGNFADPDSMKFDNCTYWSQTTRDNLPIALETSTPTPTWTFKK
ncbi:hypothetical protein [Methanoregula sp.]|jgi:hypothetical protein|uniref:hypothetical protein n=1 Tax=Methanoregula sp. TaxID=2052170 RepID=UPI002634534B|nr:hypothetical protein [Methanoregula sp.]MDD5141875.1 hypothetical protein [Methanoregula sp.]